MSRLKKVIIISISVIACILIIILSTNFCNLLILTGTDKPIIEKDYSSILFEGEKYVPFLKEGYIPYDEGVTRYKAVVKGHGLFYYLLSSNLVYKCDSYSDMIWLISDNDRGYANYAVFILEDSIK